MENDIITKRTEEVINFISYRETNDFRYDYVKAFLIELIPFRNTIRESELGKISKNMEKILPNIVI